MSSRPEEFHLRALPEPCMTLSSHTAPDVRPLPLNGFASSTGSSCFQLATGQGRTTQPLRSSPITGPSTLLRAAPPLRPASVLSPSRPSRLEPLALVPSRHRRGEAQVLTFHTKAWSSFATPTCRLPLGL